MTVDNFQGCVKHSTSFFDKYLALEPMLQFTLLIERNYRMIFSKPCTQKKNLTAQRKYLRCANNRLISVKTKLLKRKIEWFKCVYWLEKKPPNLHWDEIGKYAHFFSVCGIMSL